jgi:hypothetical protein
MYKVHLFQYKSQFHYVFNVNPWNQSCPIILSWGRQNSFQGAGIDV